MYKNHNKQKVQNKQASKAEKKQIDIYNLAITTLEPHQQRHDPVLLRGPLFQPQRPSTLRAPRWLQRPI